MDRRRFLQSVTGTAAGVVTILLPKPVLASVEQHSTGQIVLSDATSFADAVDLDTVTRTVSRVFARPQEPAPPASFPEDLTFLTTVALAFPTHADAVDATPGIAKDLRAMVKQYYGDHWDVSPLEQEALPDLGDDAWGWTYTMAPTVDGLEEWHDGIVTVVEGAWLQVLRARTADGDAIRALAELSAATLDRWPGRSEESPGDDSASGGLWEALPTLDDLPEGIVIDQEWTLDGAL